MLTSDWLQAPWPCLSTVAAIRANGVATDLEAVLEDPSPH